MICNEEHTNRRARVTADEERVQKPLGPGCCN